MRDACGPAKREEQGSLAGGRRPTLYASLRWTAPAHASSHEMSGVYTALGTCRTTLNELESAEKARVAAEVAACAVLGLPRLGPPSGGFLSRSPCSNIE